MTVLTPRPTTADLVRGVVVAVLAILQVLVSAVGSSSIGAVAGEFPTPINAAGYAFSIWGLIYLGVLVYAGYALLPGQRGRSVHRRIGWWVAASAVLNPLWILAFTQGWVVTAQVVLVGLLVVLAVVHARLSHTVADGWGDRLAMRLPLALYLGWVSAATVIAVMVAGVAVGLPPDGALPQVAGILLLVVLTAVALSVIGSTAGFAGFAAALCWALVAISVNDRPLVIAAVALVAAALILVQAVRRTARAVQPVRVALG
ncbi:hypothetical protein [Pseudonocardia spirodelae]|uniref:Tryptophan-rich sensory protein n=1 Tax=Pseudonocardia spirodelae TaxID=3133431 RepID=A0ABU8T4Y6_9PSEU